MLVDGGSEIGSILVWLADPPTVARTRPRTARARHSLFDRYMKTQLRLAGGRRKLGRNGFSSDRQTRVFAPPNICATPLRDPPARPCATTAVGCKSDSRNVKRSVQRDWGVLFAF